MQRREVKYINNQKYSDCQLVAAVNALIFHGLFLPSDECYEELVDITGCRHGAAISIEKGHKRLGLRVVANGHKALTLKWIRDNLPIDLSVHLPTRGFHNVLVIKVRDGRLWMANYARGHVQAVTWSTLKREHAWLWKMNWIRTRSLQPVRVA